MRRKGSLLIAVVWLLCVGLWAAPASAFEFELEAGFAWNFYSGWQAGREGFFGPWDVDAGGRNVRNLNFWAGANKWDGIFPNAHVATNTQYMEFSPQFRINQAVRVRGNYYIGSWDGVNADPAGSEYLNSSAPGMLVSFSPGYWNQLWAGAQTPFGLIVVGKRPFSFGMGGLESGEDCATTESFALISPYGPFRFGLLFYPARTPADATVTTIASAAFLNDPSIMLQDENGGILRDPHLAGFFTYSAGNLSIGGLWEYVRSSLGPDDLVGGATAVVRQNARDMLVPYDSYINSTIWFIKYYNGRFFFNAELDVMESTARRRPNINGNWGGSASVGGVAGAGSVFQTGHAAINRFYTETGVVVGPSKLTGLWAWVDGFDRRHGVLIDKQNTGTWLAPPLGTGDALGSWSNESPNGIVFYPYSYLLVFNYGGGNNFFNVQGDGYLTDANVYAARIDYSCAANLNLWGSFFWAERLSKGYGWGYIAPDGAEANVAYNRLGTYAAPAPAIPDNHLGWEVNLGADWQLLEGLMFNARFAYWQPGKWFTYACRSRANDGWNAPGAGNNYGAIPDRTIDPVMALEIVVGAEF